MTKLVESSWPRGCFCCFHSRLWLEEAVDEACGADYVTVLKKSESQS